VIETKAPSHRKLLPVTRADNAMFESVSMFDVWMADVDRWFLLETFTYQLN
jgi:hypothetical protein